MSVVHYYSQTVADGTATSVIRPSDWNSAHLQNITLSGNTAGQSTIQASNVVFQGGNNVTLSANTAAGGATIVFSGAAAAGGAGADRFFKEIIQGERMTTCVGFSATNVTNRPLFLPFFLNGSGLNVKTARFLMSFGASSNRSLGGTFHCGIYSMAGSDQMTLLGSDSFSVSSTVSASSASWNGVGWVDFTGMSTLTLTTEGRYMAALMVSPVSANVTWMPVSLYGADNMPAQSKVWSNGATAQTNATYNFVPFWGVYSATTNAMPNSLNQAAVNGGNSASQFQFYGNLKEI